MRTIITLFTISVMTMLGFGSATPPVFPYGYDHMYDYDSAGVNVAVDTENLFLPSSMTSPYHYPYVNVNTNGLWSIPSFDPSEANHLLPDMMEEYAVNMTARIDVVLAYVIENIMIDGVYDGPFETLNGDADPIVDPPLSVQLAGAIIQALGCGDSFYDLNDEFADDGIFSDCEQYYKGIFSCVWVDGLFVFVPGPDGLPEEIRQLSCLPSMDYDNDSGRWVVDCNCSWAPEPDDVVVSVDLDGTLSENINNSMNAFVPDGMVTTPPTGPYLQIIKTFKQRMRAISHASWDDFNNTTPEYLLANYNDRMADAWIDLIVDLETQWQQDTNN